ncbi:MAG: invasin domain 3-containing protein, partial [Bacteroidota bacterium]|nr:invasin domain 3-containing protein [Bacteroidota bacterium]
MKNFLLLIAGTILLSSFGFAQYTGGSGDGYSSGTSTIGWASLTTSQVTASDDSIDANGSSTSVITVQIKDPSGTNITYGGETVVLSTNNGTLLSGVVDNGNGTYSQTLQSSSSGVTATVTATLNGSAITDNATVVFISLAGALDHFVISTITNHVKDQPFNITITAKDASNVTVTSFTGTVTISSTGTLSSGSGATTSFTNGVLVHSVTFSNTGNFTIIATDSAAHTDTSNTFAVVDVSLNHSTVTVQRNTISSGDTTLVKFQARDTNGDPIAATGLTVTFDLKGSGLTDGTFGSTADSLSGVYTSIFTGTTSGTSDSVRAYVGGNPITTALPAITVTPGTFSLSQSVVSVLSDTVSSLDSTIITLQAKDASGNNLTTGGLTVAFALGSGTSNGTIGSVTDNSNGTYSAKFFGTTAGTPKTITATINSSAVTSTLPTITVIPGALSLSQSIVSLSSSSVNSGSNITVTLQTKDSLGNNLTSSSGTTVFSLTGSGTSSGTFGTVSYTSNGAYSATFTGTTAGTANGITATIASNALTSTAPTITVNAAVAHRFRSSATGLWSATSTWQSSYDGGSTWSAATSTPTTGDTVNVQGGYTVTADQTLTPARVTVESGSTLTTSSGITLTLNGTGNTISGTLTIVGGSTVNVPTGSHKLNVNGGSVTLQGSGKISGDDFDALVTDGTVLLTVTPAANPNGFLINTLVNSGTTTITSAVDSGYINFIVRVAHNAGGDPNAEVVIASGKSIVFNDDIYVRPTGTINGPGRVIHDRTNLWGTDGSTMFGFINNGTVNADVQFRQSTGAITPKLRATEGSPTWNNIEIYSADGLGVDFPSGTPTVTINGTLTLTSGTFNLGALNVTMGNGSTIVRNNGTLSKAMTLAGSVNVSYTGTTAKTTSFELPSSTSALSALTVNNSGGVTLTADRTVNGTLTITSGTLADGGFTLTAKGNISNLATHNGSGKIMLTNGSVTHTLSGSGSYGNLELNDATYGSTLTGSPTVNGTFTLTSGNITTGANTLSIASSGSVSRTSGHIVGNLKKNVATGSSVVRTFEIGDATNYAPVNLTFATVSTAGNVTSTTSGSEHTDIANSGLNVSKNANRYWTLTNNGVVFTTYDATMNFVPSDLDGGATTGNFIVAKKDGGTWTRPTVGTQTATSTQATGLSSMSDFAVGELATFTLTSSAVNGSITPSGVTTKDYGTSQQFTFSPTTGYHLDSLVVDGALNTDSTTSYTFSNITTTHTIVATFAIDTYTLTYSAGANGSISGTSP